MLRLFCICSPSRHFCASTLVRQDGATLSCQVSAAEMRELDATLTLTSPVLGHGNSSRGVWSSSCSRESVPQGGGNQQSLLSIKGPAGLMGFFPERCLFCTNTQHAPPRLDDAPRVLLDSVSMGAVRPRTHSHASSPLFAGNTPSLDMWLAAAHALINPLLFSGK